MSLTTPPATFTHTYRPAYVSTGKYSNQRRFGDPDKRPGMFPKSVTTTPQNNFDSSATLNVYRDGELDLAELGVSIGSRTSCEVCITLSAAQLRALAANLLDAANDIETNPASTLLANDTSKAAA